MTAHAAKCIATVPKTTLYDNTMCLKTMHLTIDHNFGKCRPIFIILSLTDSQGNSLCNYYRAFHLTFIVLLHYFAKIKK